MMYGHVFVAKLVRGQCEMHSRAVYEDVGLDMRFQESSNDTAL